METTKEIMEKVKPMVTDLEEKYKKYDLKVIIKSFVQYGWDDFLLEGLPEEIIEKRMKEIHPQTTIGWKIKYENNFYGDFEAVGNPGAFSDLPNLEDVNVDYVIVGSKELLFFIDSLSHAIENIIRIRRIEIANDPSRLTFFVPEGSSTEDLMKRKQESFDKEKKK